MTSEKHIDEGWKEKANTEKEVPQDADHPQAQEGSEGSENYEVNFTGYVTSLGFQAMIFLGEIPHPVTNQTEKNLKQAKFLIDTLLLLREKTKGNLEDQEQAILDSAIYELQMKYVEILPAEGKI